MSAGDVVKLSSFDNDGTAKTGETITIGQHSWIFSVRQLPETEAVLAGMVVPQALHVASASLPYTGGTQYISGSSTAQNVIFPNVSVTKLEGITYNDTTGEFTIVQAGTYRLYGSASGVSGGSDWDAQVDIRVDGAEVGSFAISGVFTDQDSGSCEAILDLTAARSSISIGYPHKFRT